jgi:hypothetical protein
MQCQRPIQGIFAFFGTRRHRMIAIQTTEPGLPFGIRFGDPKLSPRVRTEVFSHLIAFVPRVLAAAGLKTA